ncbi:MAG: KH domain-containing protein [Armatimonadetes bacterium]|nr:KH domain-containing protein [Armatimonadota bacterium]
MEWAEGTGRTLEEAQQNALEQLGVSEDQVEFHVMERPSGLSGLLGRAHFKVRAELRAEEADEQPAAEEEQQAVMKESTETPPHADLAEAARELLQRMVTLMGSDGVVEIGECSEDEVTLNIEGEDLGILIGRHGATLDAIQLIVAIAANRQVDEGARVIIDAEGYRERHRQLLEARARQHAEEAKSTGREVVIPDLKGYERRCMHMALKDDPDVETYSEGEGDDRVLVISPR